MNTTSKTLTVELPTTGKNAIITIVRLQQQHPAIGDGVITELTIALPAGDDLDLDESIRFSERVQVGLTTLNYSPLAASLYPGWGEYNAGTRMREQYRRFITSKWSEGFAQAEEFALTEVQKLVDALTVRAEALRNAEA